MENKKSNHPNGGSSSLRERASSESNPRSSSRTGSLPHGGTSSAQKTENKKSDHHNGSSSSSREKGSSESNPRRSSRTGGSPHGGTSSAQKTENKKSDHHNGGSSSSIAKASSGTGGSPHGGKSSAQKTENKKSDHHGGSSSLREKASSESNPRSSSRTGGLPNSGSSSAQKIEKKSMGSSTKKGLALVSKGSDGESTTKKLILKSGKSGKSNASSKGKRSSQFRHPKHAECQLTLMRQGNPFECSGCKELGFGPRYLCEKERCHFVLHDQCAMARPTDLAREHPFEGGRKFKFIWRPPAKQTTRICDACGRDIRGFAYQSQHKLYLHPCCMNLKMIIRSPDGKMELKLQDKVTSNCVKCKRKNLVTENNRSFKVWSYSCGKECFHVYCVKKLIADNWVKGSLPTTVVERRSTLRPTVTRVLTRATKIIFGVLLTVLFGHPGPLFNVVYQLLLEV